MTDVQNLEHHQHDHLAHVTLSESVEKDIPRGPTPVRQLKAELGVDPADMLFRIGEHGRKHPLADDDIVDVHSGEHFESIRGGGVS